MGYQESILVCQNKKDFDKLCKALNNVKPKLEDNVNVYAIGRLKQTIDLLDPTVFEPKRCGYISAGTYFVWWGGERHPFQSCLARTQDEARILQKLLAAEWDCIFCDYIADIEDLLFGIDTQKKGLLQENDITYLFELPDNDVIREEYVKMIITQ